MKIGARLLILIISLLLSIVLISSIFVLRFINLRDINLERASLSNLGEAHSMTYVRTLELLIKPIGSAVVEWEAAQAGLDDAYVALDRVTLLPRLNNRIAKAIKTVNNRQGLRSKFEIHLREEIDMVQAELDKATDLGGNFVLMNLPNLYPIQSSGLTGRFLEILESIQEAIEAYCGNLQSTLDTISAHEEHVQFEFSAMTSRIIVTSISISFLLILLGLIFGIAMVRSIRIPITRIRNQVGLLSMGDLTGNFEITGKDEITELASDMEGLLTKLKAFINTIKNETHTFASIKNQLLNSADLNNSAVKHIQDTLEGIKGEVDSLGTTIQTSSHLINSIREVIDEVNRQIDDQTSMIEESTASVTEMISSIQNVARTTTANKESAEMLVNLSQVGNGKLEETVGAITDIHNSIDDIRDMAGMIESIASQTNLLAMNAAIEAAHAGDAGKGFSVVADEIRKLAEASSENSREIANSLQNILERIELAVSSSRDTTHAFGDITKQVGVTESAFSEISGSMVELEVGSRQILEAMDRLQNISMTVARMSQQLEDVSREMGTSFSEVEGVSSNTQNGIESISREISDIYEHTSHLSVVSQGIENISNNLEKSVSRFTVKNKQKHSKTQTNEDETLQELPMVEAESV